MLIEQANVAIKIHGGTIAATVEHTPPFTCPLSRLPHA